MPGSFFMPQPSTFKFFVPFNKAYIDKSTNKMVVEGLASTTEVDLSGEKMAESAIKSMSQSNLPLDFRSEHKGDWDAVLGSVVELSATPDHQLLMKAELDADHPNAHFLFGKLQKGSQLGLSIGGQVNDWAWEHDATIGKAVRTYKDIALQEVSVTSHPAVASTFLSAINKSLTMKEPSMDKHPAVEKTDTVIPAPNEGQPVELEPADSVIAEEIIDGQSGTDVANPVVPATPVNEASVPLNPDQPAPADQPAAAPETPHTPGDSATPEQVAAQEDKTPANEATEPVVAETPTVPANPVAPATDAAGSQEAHSTESTQPDATPHTEKSVAKSVYLGEYAETEATVGVIDDLADRLTSAVWNTIGDDNMDAATQKATIDATLTEFHSLVMKVATVLIDADAASDAVEAAEDNQEGVEPAMKAHRETRATLSKSLDATAAELASVKEALADRSVTLSEKEATLATAIKDVATIKEALALAQKSLSDAQQAAQTENARKSYQIASKFDTALNMSAKADPSDLDKTFAAFITGK
jgi:HK97 family phage prohead protease